MLPKLRPKLFRMWNIISSCNQMWHFTKFHKFQFYNHKFRKPKNPLWNVSSQTSPIKNYKCEFSSLHAIVALVLNFCH